MPLTSVGLKVFQRLVSYRGDRVSDVCEHTVRGEASLPKKLLCLSGIVLGANLFVDFAKEHAIRGWVLTSLPTPRHLFGITTYLGSSTQTRCMSKGS